MMIEPEQLARRRGGADHAADASDMPAAAVVVRCDGIPDPALDLDAENQRVKKVAAAKTLPFDEREHRQDDRCRKVNHGRQMSVVEVEDIGHRGIDEYDVQRIEP